MVKAGRAARHEHEFEDVFEDMVDIEVEDGNGWDDVVVTGRRWDKVEYFKRRQATLGRLGRATTAASDKWPTRDHGASGTR